MNPKKDLKDHDHQEDYATVVSIINEPGLDSGGDRSLYLSKKQITDFCQKESKGIKILDEHNQGRRIGETIKLLEMNGFFLCEQKTCDKESIEKLLNGKYVGSSIGMRSLLYGKGPNARICAKAINEISLTENPDRESAQIIQIRYKGKVYNRKWDDSTNFFAFTKDRKAVYDISELKPQKEIMSTSSQPQAPAHPQTQTQVPSQPQTQVPTQTSNQTQPPSQTPVPSRSLNLDSRISDEQIKFLESLAKDPKNIEFTLNTLTENKKRIEGMRKENAEKLKEIAGAYRDQVQNKSLDTVYSPETKKILEEYLKKINETPEPEKMDKHLRDVMAITTQANSAILGYQKQLNLTQQENLLQTQLNQGSTGNNGVVHPETPYSSLFLEQSNLDFQVFPTQASAGQPYSEMSTGKKQKVEDQPKDPSEFNPYSSNTNSYFSLFRN